MRTWAHWHATNTKWPYSLSDFEIILDKSFIHVVEQMCKRWTFATHKSQRGKSAYELARVKLTLLRVQTSWTLKSIPGISHSNSSSNLKLCSSFTLICSCIQHLKAHVIFTAQFLLFCWIVSNFYFVKLKSSCFKECWEYWLVIFLCNQ